MERVMRTDTELLDDLEGYINENGGLIIHNDGYDQAKRSSDGLGLRCTGRTLRQALEQCMKTYSDSTGTY